ncbi:hypothetical protein IAR55_004565 [Kwoniella newhampshirensis]|uniref:Uncharacterized protein n=1 Tax=Kwoniella newhampshirensis TaxID=1651941 RepID=A0AAW0YPT8_9TREE
MTRNQPESNIPAPIFSPTQSNAESTEGTVRGSYNSRYDPALAEKAKKEYEDWVARKAEREGGVGGEDSGGTRNWVPKDRDVARPGAVEGIAHSDAYEGKPMAQLEAHPQTVQPWVYPFPTGDHDQSYDPSQQAMEAFYPPQGYWDPSYWWGTGDMGGMGAVGPVATGDHDYDISE